MAVETNLYIATNPINIQLFYGKYSIILYYYHCNNNAKVFIYVL